MSEKPRPQPLWLLSQLVAPLLSAEQMRLVMEQVAAALRRDLAVELEAQKAAKSEVDNLLDRIKEEP